MERFFEDPVPDERDQQVFSHNDLGDEHLVMAPDGADVAGVIDWRDAVLGDPARDLALLAFDFGPGVLDLVLDRLEPRPDAGLRGRALWFAGRVLAARV